MLCGAQAPSVLFRPSGFDSLALLLGWLRGCKVTELGCVGTWRLQLASLGLCVILAVVKAVGRQFSSRLPWWEGSPGDSPPLVIAPSHLARGAIYC